MLCLHVFILLVVLQIVSAQSGTRGENVGAHHGYTARDIIRAIEREVVQEHLGSTGISGSTDDDIQESSIDSSPDDLSGIPLQPSPLHSRKDPSLPEEQPSINETQITNSLKSTDQESRFKKPTIYRGEGDYEYDHDEDNRATEDERANGYNDSRMEPAHLENVADVMRKLKKSKTDEEMASKLRTGAKQVMHSIVDDMVTKTTQTVAPKIDSLVDRGLKTVLANNASSPVRLVKNSNYNSNTTEHSLYNRETVKADNVNKPVNSPSKKRHLRHAHKHSKHHVKGNHLVGSRFGNWTKETKGPITTVVSFMSGKDKLNHDDNNTLKTENARKRHHQTITKDVESASTQRKHKARSKIDKVKHRLKTARSKDSQKDVTKVDFGDVRKIKKKNISERPEQGDSVKKQLVAKEGYPMNSTMPSPVAQTPVLQQITENTRIDAIQYKVDRIQNDLTILQTAVAGVIKRLDDIGRVVEDVSNLTQKAILEVPRQQSPKGGSPLGGLNSSVIKIIIPSEKLKAASTNITGFKLGISEIRQQEPQRAPQNIPGSKQESTFPANHEVMSSNTQELFPEIKGSSGVPFSALPMLKGKDVHTDILEDHERGNGTTLPPGTSSSNDEVQLFPNGGFANVTEALQGTEPPTHAPIEPLPGSNGMLVNKSQNANGTLQNKYHGKSPGNAAKVADKAHNVFVTESPTHTTMEPLPGTGGRTSNKSRSNHDAKFPIRPSVQKLPETGESAFDGPTQEPELSSSEGFQGKDQSYSVNNESETGKGLSTGKMANASTPGTEMEGTTSESSSANQAGNSEPMKATDNPMATAGVDFESFSSTPTPSVGQGSDSPTPTPGPDQASDHPEMNSQSDQSDDVKGNSAGTDQTDNGINTDSFSESQSDLFGNQLPFALPGPFPIQSPLTPPYFMRFEPPMEAKPTPHTRPSSHQILVPLGAINGFQQDDENSDNDNSDDADERHNVHNDVDRIKNVPPSVAQKGFKIRKPAEEEMLNQPFREEGDHVVSESSKPKHTIHELRANAAEQQKVAMGTPKLNQKTNDVRPIINIIVPNKETASLLSREMCQPSCKNGGKCVSINTCKCPTLFVGDQCERFSLFDLLKKNRDTPHKVHLGRTLSKSRSLHHQQVTVEELLRSLARRYRLPRRHRQLVNNPFARDNTHYGYHGIRGPLSYELPDSVDSNAYRYQNIRYPNYYRFQNNEGDYYDNSVRKKSIIPRTIIAKINPITKRKQYILDV